MSVTVRGICDADVVGDGPAALVAAIALAHRGWQIRLITPSRHRPGQSRIDVLGASALPSLLRLGLSRDDLHAIAKPCPGIWCRWDTDDAQCYDYLTGPYGSAWALDRNGFESLLRVHVAKAGIISVADNQQPPLRKIDATLASAQHDEGRWRVLASGRVSSRPSPQSADCYNDKLIALVAFGKVNTAAEPFDTRLHIEAAADGWAYGIAGPDNLVCLGVITDAESLAGKTPSALASIVLSATDRIARLVNMLGQSIAFQAIPIPCRWLPLKVDLRTVRLGDAHASFDPLAGRGLWSAIRMAEEVTIALDTCPDELVVLEQKSLASYERYLTERRSLYRAGRDRFGTGFWTRRCAPS